MDDLFVGSPDLSDLDSISIISTIASEPQEEYALDCILAERDDEGVREYLVKWHGYDELRSTWEAEENFRNDMTIPEWEKRKVRIVQGLEPPFDVADLESRIERMTEETESRKARRQAKRKKLGMRVASVHPEDNSEYEERGSKASSVGGGESILKVSSSRPTTNQHRRRLRDSSTSTDSKSEDDIPLIRHAVPRRKKGIAVKLKKASDSQRRTTKDDIAFIVIDDDDDDDDNDDDRAGDESLFTKKLVPTIKGGRFKETDNESMVSKKNDTQSEAIKRANSESKKKQVLENKTSRSPSKPVVGRSQAAMNDTTKESAAKESTAKNSTVENTTAKDATTRDIAARDTIAKNSMAKDNSCTSVKAISTTRGTAKPRLPFMANGRGPARPINRSAHKSAPSTGRPEVTGAAIFNNWSKDVKRQGPWQARSRELPRASEKKAEGQIKTLSWKNKYQKAGRNELAPNVSQLNLFSPKNMPQNRKSTSISVNTTTSKRPFQLIQDDLAKKNPESSSTRMVETSGNDPMEDINQTMITDTHVESPVALGADENLISVMHDTDQHPQKKMDMHTEKDASDPWSIQHQVHDRKNSNTGTGDNQPVLPSPVESFTIPKQPRRMISATASTNDHGKSFFIPKRSRGELVKDVRFADANSAKLSETWKEPSFPNKTSTDSTVAFEGDMREDDLCEASDVSEKHATTPFIPHIQPLMLNHIEGDQGMIKKTIPDLSPDLSDILGTIVLGAEREAIALKLRGAYRELKKLMFTVKVPPRQVHFLFEHVCTADDYNQFFHRVRCRFYYIRRHSIILTNFRTSTFTMGLDILCLMSKQQPS